MENIIQSQTTTAEMPMVVDSNFKLAAEDVIAGYKSYRLWSYLALNEIRRRYRRTTIGPFWTTLSVGVFIFSLGFVLSNLWNTEVKTFLPYFCSGYIYWMLFSTTITEGCTTFTSHETFLKQLSIPYINFAFLIAWRNFIIFFHHFVVLVLVFAYCHQAPNLYTLLAIPGLVINFIASVWMCLFLGIICTRYRDIQQVITSLLQISMFVTPIMWNPEQMGSKGALVTSFNPIYHFMSIIRKPLLGQAPTFMNWTITIVCTLLLIAFTFDLFRRKYRSIIFWL